MTAVTSLLAMQMPNRTIVPLSLYPIGFTDYFLENPNSLVAKKWPKIQKIQKIKPFYDIFESS